MTLLAPRFRKAARLQQAATIGPSLRKGEQGRGVRDLQLAFLDLRFRLPHSTHNGRRPLDGIFGSETESVVKAFQSREKLVVDGIVGKKTLIRLDQIFQENDPFYQE